MDRTVTLCCHITYCFQHHCWAEEQMTLTELSGQEQGCGCQNLPFSSCEGHVHLPIRRVPLACCHHGSHDIAVTNIEWTFERWERQNVTWVYVSLPLDAPTPTHRASLLLGIQHQHRVSFRLTFCIHANIVSLNRVSETCFSLSEVLLCFFLACVTWFVHTHREERQTSALWPKMCSTIIREEKYHFLSAHQNLRFVNLFFFFLTSSMWVFFCFFVFSV